MPLSQQELELRMKALERISQKLLPAEVPPSIWAGRGSGQTCSLCDKPVGQSETEYELEAMADGLESHFRFHIRCHALWQLAVAGSSEN